MRHASHRRAVRGGGWVVILMIAALGAPIASGAEVLFPKALHLTRRIEDPLSGPPIVVEEYCAGNRVVSVLGERTVIADYGRQEMIEVDRAAATYSITGFAEISGAMPAKVTASQQSGVIPQLVATRRSGSLQRLEVRTDGVRLELEVDHGVSLRREALDVLAGAAYPHRPSSEQQLILNAAAGGLPIEQVTTYELGGATVRLRSVVTRVGDEVAPPEALFIPPGAVRVDSRLAKTARAASDLDRR